MAPPCALHRDQVKLAVTDAALAHRLVGQAPDGLHRALQHRDLQAGGMIEMDMQGRELHVVMGVLRPREPPAKVARRMVVDIGEGRDTGAVVFAFGVCIQALACLQSAQEVAQRFGAARIAMLLHVAIQRRSEIVVDRHRKSLHRHSTCSTSPSMHNSGVVHTRALLCVVLSAAAGSAWAQMGAQTGAQTAPRPNPGLSPDPFGTGTGASTVLPAITVTAPRALEAEPTNAASEKRISGETLNTRPIERPGEMLEAAPGLIVTQHSGEGKANQYFLRGMNLDHGTDLALWLDGMPLNMRTHGHGQGYADINFLIPELVEQMTVKKGPYWAEEGDFASAGSLRLAYADRLDRSVISATGGSFGYWRGLAAGTIPFGKGSLTGAAEFVAYNGPWDVPDTLRKYNGFLRYSEGTPDNGLAITALAYSNSWHSTDQIPVRAVSDGSLGRFGGVDQTDGGDTQRYSLSMRWSRSDEQTASKVEAYAIYSTTNLYSNFTYFLDDPDKGDQFQQSDKRKILGFNASHLVRHKLAGLPSETTIGTQVRYDDIAVGLFKTFQRTPLSTLRADQVSESSIGLHAKNTTQWTDWMKVTLGLRGDFFTASVASDNPANSGAVSAFLASPKAGIVFGPFDKTEFYLNAGMGYHSNDARGATITVNPADPTMPQVAVPLLVRSKGAEIGVRSQRFKGFDTSEASRPSRRVGVEWTNSYRPTAWAAFDLDLAFTQARFSDYSSEGNLIPGAPDFVGSAGVTLGADTGWFGALRLRSLGPRPLTSDGSVWSSFTTTLNGRIGYVFDSGIKINLDAYNLLNTQGSQIDYYYTSRLPGEAAEGVADRHFHPIEPLAFRLTLAKAF
jgi:TonB-dependent Receptor Plug Domain/TonB dependent receptor